MPVLACPHCRKQIRVPDSAAGKRARCPLCQEAFVVPGDDEDAVTEDRPPPRSRGPSREEEDRPRRPRDEDEDDRPRRRPSRDEDDDEDDRPRRRAGANRFSDLDDDDRRRPRSRSVSRSTRDEWRWGWSPLIGITYGPIPVGLIIALCVLAVVVCLGALNGGR